MSEKCRRSLSTSQEFVRSEHQSEKVLLKCVSQLAFQDSFRVQYRTISYSQQGLRELKSACHSIILYKYIINCNLISESFRRSNKGFTFTLHGGADTPSALETDVTQTQTS